VLDHLTQHAILRVPVAPGDAAPDQEGLGLVAVVVGAVETEVAQRGELGLDAVAPAGGVVTRPIRNREAPAPEPQLA